MKNITIPKGAYMRLRAKGRYLYAKNGPVTIWEDKVQRIPADTPVYCISWRRGQNSLMASKIINSNELREDTA